MLVVSLLVFFVNGRDLNPRPLPSFSLKHTFRILPPENQTYPNAQFNQKNDNSGTYSQSHTAFFVKAYLLCYNDQGKTPSVMCVMFKNI